jgi:hypothetical protein
MWAARSAGQAGVVMRCTPPGAGIGSTTGRVLAPGCGDWVRARIWSA